MRKKFQDKSEAILIHTIFFIGILSLIAGKALLVTTFSIQGI